MDDEFDITSVCDAGGETVLAVSGEVDVATGELLHRRLAQVLAHRRDLVVDLSAVTFFDCSGLRVLMAARRRAALAGVGLRLRGLSPSVERVLRFTRLRSVFTVDPEPASRVRALAARPGRRPPGGPGLAHSA
ncbi:STAS domain-containing protein [Streptomyces sp. ICBB 8177]|uniref:STAS domain-containing protein n=1 Tax=Streptomyces sp. ICBB 8177 TaxID=563922 RepID=UPI000D6832F5|nr:STAS domain-containing protein [Streptomyces sp. ICBB 8177]PWI42826.1 hypothetical protein CK485_11175 [Streptomyces sp. ICBB 8177]